MGGWGAGGGSEKGEGGRVFAVVLALFLSGGEVAQGARHVRVIVRHCNVADQSRISGPFNRRPTGQVRPAEGRGGARGGAKGAMPTLNLELLPLKSQSLPP